MATMGFTKAHPLLSALATFRCSPRLGQQLVTRTARRRIAASQPLRMGAAPRAGRSASSAATLALRLARAARPVLGDDLAAASLGTHEDEICCLSRNPACQTRSDDGRTSTTTGRSRREPQVGEPIVDASPRGVRVRVLEGVERRWRRAPLPVRTGRRCCRRGRGPRRVRSSAEKCDLDARVPRWASTTRAGPSWGVIRESRSCQSSRSVLAVHELTLCTERAPCRQPRVVEPLVRLTFSGDPQRRAVRA